MDMSLFQVHRYGHNLANADIYQYIFILPQGFSQDFEIGCTKYNFSGQWGNPVYIISKVKSQLLWVSKIRIGCPKDGWIGL